MVCGAHVRCMGRASFSHTAFLFNYKTPIVQFILFSSTALLINASPVSHTHISLLYQPMGASSCASRCSFTPDLGYTYYYRPIVIVIYMRYKYLALCATINVELSNSRKNNCEFSVTNIVDKEMNKRELN